MSRVKTNYSLTEIDHLLDHTHSLLEQHIAKGNYVDAENCKLAIAQIKRDREAARLR